MLSLFPGRRLCRQSGVFAGRVRRFSRLFEITLKYILVSKPKDKLLAELSSLTLSPASSVSKLNIMKIYSENS